MIRLPIWLEDVWYLPTLLLLSSACCSNLWKAALIIADWLWTRQTNRSRLVALICDKLKLCEYTFLLWFCFILYHPVLIQVSALAVCTALLLFSSFLMLLHCWGIQSFSALSSIVLCQIHTCSWPSCLQYCRERCLKVPAVVIMKSAVVALKISVQLVSLLWTILQRFTWMNVQYCLDVGLKLRIILINWLLNSFIYKMFKNYFWQPKGRYSNFLLFSTTSPEPMELLICLFYAIKPKKIGSNFAHCNH